MTELIRKPLTKLPRQQFHTLCLNIVEAFVLIPSDVLEIETNAFADALQDYLDVLSYSGTKEKTKQLQKELKQLVWAWNSFRNDVRNASLSPISELKNIGVELQSVVGKFNIYHKPFEEKMSKLNTAVSELESFEKDIKLLGSLSYIEMAKSKLPECRRISDERKKLIQQNKGKSAKARKNLNDLYQTLLSYQLFQ